MIHGPSASRIKKMNATSIKSFPLHPPGLFDNTPALTFEKFEATYQLFCFWVSFSFSSFSLFFGFRLGATGGIQ
jgi:hypothetical protein